MPGRQAQVTGINGFMGTIDVSEVIHHETGDYLRLQIDDTREAWVPKALFQRKTDGSYFLPVSVKQIYSDGTDEAQEISVRQERAGILPDTGKFVVPVAEEELEVSKQIHQSGIRIDKKVHTEQEEVDVPGYREHVEVQRIERNEVLDGPVSARKEGDTLIIPIVEEQVVVEKRLVLKEEVRVTVRHEELEHKERIPVRKETVEIHKQDR